MAGGFDGSIRVDTKIDSKGFNAGIASMTNAVNGLGAALGIALGGAAIVAFGKSAVGAAMEVTNALTGLQSVMNGQGRSFTDAKKFIDGYIKDGLVPLSNAVKAYQNLAQRGYSDEQIRQTLTALKDSAAFGRQAALTLGAAVQTASEGLRNENSILVDNAGVTKNVSIMWQDYAKSIGTTVGALTQQQKIQAEVSGIMQETRFQTGDAAKIAGSFSGQVSALSTSFYNLKVAIGNAVIPVLGAIIPWIKGVIDWFTVLFNVIARVIAIFFGVNVSMASTEAAAGGAADATAAIAGAAGDAAGSAGDLAGNTKKAEKAAKGALAAFDQLNVLQTATPTDTTPTGGGKPGGGGGGGLPPPGGGLSDAVNKQIDALTAKVEAFKQKLLAFFEPLREPFARLGAAITALGGTIWDGLKWAWDNILVPLGTWLVQAAAPVFIDLLTAGVNLLNEALKALAPMGAWLFDNFLKPLADWTGKAIIDALKWLTDRLNDLSKWIKDNPEDFRTMTVVIAEFFLAWKIWDLIGGLASLVTSFLATTGVLIGHTAAWIASTAAKIADKAETAAIMALYAGDFIKYIALSAVRLAEETVAWIASTAAKIAANVSLVVMNITTGIWNVIAGIATAVTWAFGAAVAFLISPIGLVIIAIIAIIVIIVLLIAYWPQISAAALVAWEWIKQKWSEASAWFNSVVVEPIKRWFNQAWIDIKRWASEAWTNIQTAWNGAMKWFQETVIDPIKKGFDTALSNIDTAFTTTFNGIKDMVKGVVNAILSFINGMIQGVARGINRMIDSINSFKFTVPSLFPGAPGYAFGLNLSYVNVPSVPLLAQGAVIPPNARFLAMLGDQRGGRNIEAPEDLIRQIVREETLGMQLQGETIIRFEGTMGALIRAMQPYITKENARTGGSLVMGGAA